MTAIGGSLHGSVPSDDAHAGRDPIDQDAADRALLQRLRAGEDAAYGELFARHAAAVRRLAYGLVHDRSDAEDLTAEAFFRVLQAIRRGAGPVDNVRGYLLIVARRVAWEWRSRRRDVPVSDEELTHRAGAGPDTSNQSTERSLITRAFTSLPERWRSVLWKVEVEGERPAVVATNFGLSANATAALARRARQGLRAAYLQAHLAAERSSTGCRWVLEKLGAYTAGSIKGSERRRIRAHLAGCPPCAAMHAELHEVCSGLRAHAALLAVPLGGLAALELAATSSGPAVAGGLGVTVKGLLASAKLQVAVAASSAAVGVLGIVAGSWGATQYSTAPDDLDGRRETRLTITEPVPTSSSQTIALTSGVLSTVAVVPASRTRPTGTGSARPPATVAAPAADTGGYDEDAQVVYRETTVEQNSETYADYTLVYETKSVTEVNSADQTSVWSTTTTSTKVNPLSVSGETTSTAPQTPAATSSSGKPTTATGGKGVPPPPSR
ncbi:sigma-70 family RNA polymerase sigma factor [Actinophytocola sp.]|uniref:sigma-70 family RNA polymerase sigma factor n=1 Tax=Actinophytocola sp. TaxID=1872138 RepID=UPI002D7ED78B|nr:sigma-70 family RNA polymerase sigma factor [Actinophytocola sp.]HET9143491.1 sigma-70 family RNA polymerase sigma factor [Actinophytocola sp.]